MRFLNRKMSVPIKDWNTGVYDDAVGLTVEDGGVKFTVLNWGKPVGSAFVNNLDLKALRDRLNMLDLG